MPIFLKRSLESGGEIGVWKITENIDYFLERMPLIESEEQLLVKTHPAKKREWLAARYLLHLMSGRKERAACLKDDFGKPYIEDSPMLISMSHSRDMTAVIASPQTCGIDIQLIVPKIKRIAQKFLHTELEFPYVSAKDTLRQLHCYWGAKESIYKAYGRKSLNFKKDMIIDSFKFQAHGFAFNGILKKEAVKRTFNLHAEALDDYILVYAIEV